MPRHIMVIRNWEGSVPNCNENNVAKQKIYSPKTGLYKFTFFIFFPFDYWGEM